MKNEKTAKVVAQFDCPAIIERLLPRHNWIYGRIRFKITNQADPALVAYLKETLETDWRHNLANIHTIRP